MQKWKLKAVVQKSISFLPFSHKINYLFQKYVTKGVFLSDDYFYDRLGHAKDHLKAFKQFSDLEIPTTCLEIGTGWYPVVPISFFLVGVEKTHSVDISFLTSKDRIKTTIKKFIEADDKNELKTYLDYKEEKFSKLTSLLSEIDALSLEEILKRINLEYNIEDARSLSLKDNSIDLVNSNNTFEHIYPDILIPILKDFKRVVNKDHGVMSHFIDMSDHFAHFDSTINIYNFLKYSDQQWKRIDNSIQPQSRLRFDDYLKIYKDLKIPISAETHRAGNLEYLKSIKLDSSFKDKDLETNAISHCQLVSKMSG